MENKLLLKNLNFENIINLNLTLEEYGLLSYIQQSGYQEFSDLERKFPDYNISKILKKIAQKPNFTLKIEQTGDLVIWEIEYQKVEKSVSDFELDQQILKLFKIDQKLQPHLIVSNRQTTLNNIYNYINVNADKFVLKQQLTIDSEAKYLEYLKNSNPITLLLENNATVNLDIIDFFYEELISKEKDIAMMNLAIDYCISTSYYKNFSLKFLKLMFNSWEKVGANDFEKALNYLFKVKQQKAQGKYIENDWNEEDEKHQAEIEQKFKAIADIELDFDKL